MKIYALTTRAKRASAERDAAEARSTRAKRGLRTLDHVPRTMALWPCSAQYSEGSIMIQRASSAMSQMAISSNGKSV